MKKILMTLLMIVMVLNIAGCSEVLNEAGIDTTGSKDIIGKMKATIEAGETPFMFKYSDTSNSVYTDITYIAENNLSIIDDFDGETYITIITPDGFYYEEEESELIITSETATGEDRDYIQSMYNEYGTFLNDLLDNSIESFAFNTSDITNADGKILARGEYEDGESYTTLLHEDGSYLDEDSSSQFYSFTFDPSEFEEIVLPQ